MLKGEVAAEGTPGEVVNRYVGLVHDNQSIAPEKSDLPATIAMAIQRAGSPEFGCSIPKATNHQ